MESISSSRTQSPTGGESSVVVLLEIYRALQRLENRLEGQDERLVTIEASIRSESSSLADKYQIPSPHSTEYSRPFSASGRERPEKPVTSASAVLRSYSMKERRNNLYQFHENSTDPPLEENISGGVAPDLPSHDEVSRAALSPHARQKFDKEDEDTQSVSVYSIHTALEGVQSSSLSIQVVANTPTALSRPPLGESLDSPISIAYNDVESDGPPSTKRPSTPESRESTASSSKIRKQWANASAKLTIWTGKVKSEISRRNLEVIKRPLALVGEINIYGTLGNLHDMAEEFASQMGKCFSRSKKFLRKHKATVMSGWVLY